VRSGVFSPDGRRVLTTSDDGTAKLWNPATGACVYPFAGHTYWLRSGVFSPDGRRVLTVSADGTARLWIPYYKVRQRSLALLCAMRRTGINVTVAPELWTQLIFEEFLM
jgi:WD40 repeat protein